MARPAAKDLTGRELDVMHVFWTAGEANVQDVRDTLAADGRELAYTTVATLTKILLDKGYLKQTRSVRPFSYRPARTFEEVSGSMLGDVLDRVFGGSRELLLTRLMEQKRLTDAERTLLEKALKPGVGDADSTETGR